VPQLIAAQWSQILGAILAVRKQAAIGTGSCPDVEHLRSGRQLRGLLRNPSIAPDEIE
jgi:hypothetical protein